MKGKSVFKINIHLAASHVCAGNYKSIRFKYPKYLNQAFNNVIIKGIFMLRQKSENSIDHKSTPFSNVREDYREFSEEMIETQEDYTLSLHGLGENSKEIYLGQMRTFGRFLISRGIKRFEDATRKDIDLFLSRYKKDNTKNGYVTRLKYLYGKLLKQSELVEHLKIVNHDIEPVTPAELLTPDEIVKLANEASKRREMYKIIILALFESCARVSELLSLKIGDLVFSSVVDKEGHRKLIATLHFKRSKGGVNKQPVVLTMFASELKRWVDNHPLKGDSLAWLFPSPRNSLIHVYSDTVACVLWNARERLGIEKKVNPHWLRHSGLSYFANELNFNEVKLKYRAGWKNTTMAKRYIHSGAEISNKAYLEAQGYIVEEKKPEIIKPKPCLHCNALNPYTNTNCDFCAMPLDLEEYKEEIEKRRNMESLYTNLQKIYSGKISEEQKAELSHHTEVIKELTELGREDLASQYIEKLLESWVKVFLTA